MWRTLGVVVALALGAAPADAQVVATEAAGTVTLSATDLAKPSSGVRLILRGPDPKAEEGSFQEERDGFAPVWDDELQIVSAQADKNSSSHAVYLGGAVSARVARLEITVLPGRVISVDTVPGDAYAGLEKGYIRFFLTSSLTLPRDHDGDDGQVRMFDAAGTLLAVTQAPDITRRAPTIGAGVRPSLTTYLSPVPGMPERRSERFCLYGGAFDACHDAYRPQPPLMIGGRVGCRGQAGALTALAPPATQVLSVVLGSGRVLRLAARAAPFARAERVVAARLPQGQAVRGAAALGAGDAVLARADVRQPPLLACKQFRGWDVDGGVARTQYGTPPGTQLAASAGSLRLLARDDGDLLCLGLARLALDGRDCSEPLVNSHDSAVYQAKGGEIAAYVAARVATVDARLDNGTRLRVPTAPGVEYTGRYRDAVRFAMAQLPAGRKVRDANLLDAAGHVIGTAGLDEEPAAAAPLRPSGLIEIRTGKRRFRLQVAGVDDRTTPCLDLVTGAEAFDDQGCANASLAGGSYLRVTASCGPRLMLVWGLATGRVRRVEIVRADGRVVRPRLVSLRPPFKPRGRAFLAALPGNAGLARVRFVGHQAADSIDPDTVRTPFGAATRQCGYDFRENLS